MGGVGYSIDLTAQRRVFPDIAADFAYYKCFAEVIDAMVICATKNQEAVKFTFDMRRESGYNTGILYRMFYEFSPAEQSHMFSEISFAVSRENSKLQAGDLFTREVMKGLDNLIGPVKRAPRKSWQVLAATDRFHHRTVGIQYFEDLRRKMPLIQKLVGWKEHEYRKWLSDSNRQENLSNRLLYLEHLTSEERRGNKKS